MKRAEKITRDVMRKHRWTGGEDTVRAVVEYVLSLPLDEDGKPKPCPVSGACSCGDEAGFKGGACTRCGGWYSAGGDAKPAEQEPAPTPLHEDAAAVERAAAAVYRASYGGLASWPPYDDGVRGLYQRKARAALKAAQEGPDDD